MNLQRTQRAQIMCYFSAVMSNDNLSLGVKKKNEL